MKKIKKIFIKKVIPFLLIISLVLTGVIFPVTTFAVVPAIGMLLKATCYVMVGVVSAISSKGVSEYITTELNANSKSYFEETAMYDWWMNNYSEFTVYIGADYKPSVDLSYSFPSEEHKELAILMIDMMGHVKNNTNYKDYRMEQVINDPFEPIHMTYEGYNELIDMATELLFSPLASQGIHVSLVGNGVDKVISFNKDSVEKLKVGINNYYYLSESSSFTVADFRALYPTAATTYLSHVVVSNDQWYVRLNNESGMVDEDGNYNQYSADTHVKFITDDTWISLTVNGSWHSVANEKIKLDRNLVLDKNTVTYGDHYVNYNTGEIVRYNELTKNNSVKSFYLYGYVPIGEKIHDSEEELKVDFGNERAILKIGDNEFKVYEPGEYITDDDLYLGLYEKHYVTPLLINENNDVYVNIYIFNNKSNWIQGVKIFKDPNKIYKYAIDHGNPGNDGTKPYYVSNVHISDEYSNGAFYSSTYSNNIFLDFNNISEKSTTYPYFNIEFYKDYGYDKNYKLYFHPYYSKLNNTNTIYETPEILLSNGYKPYFAMGDKYIYGLHGPVTFSKSENTSGVNPLEKNDVITVPAPPTELQDVINKGVEKGIIENDNPTIKVDDVGTVTVDDVQVEEIVKVIEKEVSKPSEKSGKLDVDMPVIYDKFPFSLPFDLYNAFTIFVEEPKAPKFVIPLSNKTDGDYKVGKDWYDKNGRKKMFTIDYSVDIDMSEYEHIAQIIRILLYITFVISLIMATNKLIGRG